MLLESARVLKTSARNLECFWRSRSLSRQGGFEKMADIGPWAVMVVEVTEEYSYTDNMRSWTSTEEPVETLRGLCSGRKPKPRLTTHSMWGEVITRE